jgi:hypothetical protein
MIASFHFSHWGLAFASSTVRGSSGSAACAANAKIVASPPMSYKALFAIAAAFDYEIQQMDVKTPLKVH